MFCNQCGQTNSNDAKFCSGCGNKLEIKNIQPAQTYQHPIHTESPQPRKKQIELWNPNAAANWSLLLSPAFGAFIHMKNWKALGETEKANSSKIWFIFSIILSLFGIGFFVLIAWYFSIGKKQIVYVQEKFGENYLRKSWSTPLLIGFGISVICILLVILIPENKNDQPQQTTSQANSEAPVNSSPQTTNQQNYFDQFDSNPQTQTIEANGKSDIPVVNSQQQELKTYTGQTDEEKAHFKAIFSAHPDAGTIVESQDFKNWMNNQSSDFRKYYNYVMDKGSATQVINMLNDYKSGINR